MSNDKKHVKDCGPVGLSSLFSGVMPATLTVDIISDVLDLLCIEMLIVHSFIFVSHK